MNVKKPYVAAQSSDILGESPVCLADHNIVAWVDIGRAAWYRLDLSTGEVSTTYFQVPLTGFAPAKAGGFIGAFTDGVASFDAGGRGPTLHRPEAGIPGNRFNDAGCDTVGRFIAGTMTIAADEPGGSFYSIDLDGEISTLRSGVTIANTVAFSPDGRRLYMADTAAGELAAFHYNPETGALGSRDLTFTAPADLPGVPDGSAVDSEGYLWNARWGGGCLVRLRPDGTLDRLLPLPVSKPTSCAFLGNTLYVTTSTWEFKEKDFKLEPMAGSLLAIDVGVSGVPQVPYAGPVE